MYNKKEAKRLLDLGKNYKATHLIIFYDSFEGDEIYRYVSRGQTVDEVLNSVLNFGPAYGVEAIFNYDLDLEEQLKEDSPRHNEPSKEFKTNYEIALEYATKKHEGKVRKGNPPTPYIVHPIEVSKMISNYMKNDVDEEVYKVAALLHDTLEDTAATYYDIVSNFGSMVASIVLELTTDEDMKLILGKQQYLSIKMKNMSSWALVIKLCDRLDNVNDLVNCNDEDFKDKYINETIGIIEYLLNNAKLSNTHITIIEQILRLLVQLSQNDNEKFERLTEIINQHSKIKIDIEEYSLFSKLMEVVIKVDKGKQYIKKKSNYF